MKRASAAFRVLCAGLLIALTSTDRVESQGAGVIQPLGACTAEPSAPGCSDLTAISKALGKLMDQCRQQPKAGVCPLVAGPDVRPPETLLQPGKIQPLVPSDRLLILDGTSKNWVSISPDVAQTCSREPATVGCDAVDDVLDSVGNFQTQCRQDGSSPACRAFVSGDQGVELTRGTPTTSAGGQPVVFGNAIDGTAGRGTFTIPVIPTTPVTTGTPITPITIAPIEGSNTGSPTPVREFTPFIFSTFEPSSAGGDRPVTFTTPVVPAVDLVGSADTFQVTPGGLNVTVQVMVIDSVNAQLPASGQKDDEPARLVPASLMMRHGPMMRAAWAPMPLSSVPQDRPVEVFLTSLGTSTGEAFEMRAFNSGGSPVQLRAEGLVIQPLNADMTRRVQQQLQRAARGGGGAPARLAGYCLEFLRQPPSAGMMFQVAGSGLQQKFAPVRRILEASRLVRSAGELVPDSAPEGYFHSIRQWAIWTREQGFTAQTFADAFVSHTRKNFEQAGNRWTGDVEAVVRKAAPNRWNDIQKILQRADRR